MPGKSTREEICNCPVGTFFRDVERTFGKRSNFLNHIIQSRIEVLKAIRSLLDERIEGLGKKSYDKSQKMKNVRVK